MRALAAFVTALLIASATSVSAGDEPPSLKGQVVDASRGALPGTTVTLTANGTPVSEPLFQVTDETGAFTFAGVPAGSYSVTFSMPGFDEKKISAVVLPTSETLTIDQDATIFVSSLRAGEAVTHAVGGGRRHAYVFVVSGQVILNGRELAAGDQARLGGEVTIDIAATSDAELMLIDLP